MRSFLRKLFVVAIDRHFIKSPRNYIVQSILAAAAMAIVLVFIETLTNAAIVAGVAASTFIVFAMPKTITAQPRRLIGGHVNGIICGFICYAIFFTGPLGRILGDLSFMVWIIGAFSVGLSIFLMTITDTEHPPAAATALGIVIDGYQFETVLFILLYVVCLALVRRLLRAYLKDLF